MGGVDPVFAGVFIAAYVAVQIGVGIYAGRNVKSEEGFFVGGRSVGLLPIMISLFATWFGAETLIGSSAAIAGGGMAESRAEPFGYAICLVAMGLIFAVKFRERGYVTLADFFRGRFGPQSEFLAAVLTVVVSIIWAAAQLIALAAILEAALNIPTGLTLIAATVIVVLYTSLSGMLGDIATDVVQSLVLLAGVAVILIAVIARFGGVEPMLAAIEPEQLNLFGDGEGWLSRLDAWAIPILGSLVTQEAISRLLSVKRPQDARTAAIGAGGLYLLVGAAPLVIALAGVHLAPAGWVPGEDDFLPRLAAETLSPLLFLVFMAALLSALLSTVNSNLLSASSLFAVNVLGRVHQAATPARRLLIARVTTIGAGLIACAIAGSGSTIRDLIQLTSVFGQAGLLVAVLWGLNSGFGGPRAALWAIAAGVIVNVYTLLLWPILIAPEGGLAAWFAGEAPEFEGYFLLSVIASALAYAAGGTIERRLAPATAP